MKPRNNRYKKILIALATNVFIYFVWGYFGFVGGWIPGKYDVEKKQYKVFWGLGEKLACSNGTCRIKFYTPFKRHGLFDTSGKIIIPFKFKYVDYDRHNGKFIVAENLDGKYGLLNKKNEIIQPFKFSAKPQKLYHYYDGSEHIYSWEIEEKKLVIDSSGKEILPPEYSDILMPYEHRGPYLIASKGTYSNLVFPDGKIVQKDYLITDVTFSDSNGFMITSGIKTALLDKNIWKITKQEEIYDSANVCETILLNNRYQYTLQYGIYNKSGEVLPLDYDYIEWISYEVGICRIKQNDKWGVYNVITQQWILPQKFEDIKRAVYEDFPLISVRNSYNENYNCYDLNGVLILSNKTSVSYIDENLGYLIFYKNGNRYKLQYNKEKQKFIWHKL